ncbi:MAG: hypothetical protein VYE73_11240 [Acidobacteriota bacterium]|nr:hypothetical protein [Acidobacteriota bacterium]
MILERFRRYLPSAIAVAIAIVLPVALFAAGDIPRTASGHPDLSGTYNAATLTPLSRPAEFGENLYLTPDEAEKLAAAERDRNAEASSASDPNREAPPEGGDGSPGPAGNVGGYNNFWIDRGDDVFTVDGKFRTSIIIDPSNGQMPKMTTEGQARQAKFLQTFFRQNKGTAWWVEKDAGAAGPYDDMEQRDNYERCILGFTGAAPTIPSLYNNYKAIVQTDDHVMILIEMVHDARIVRMSSEHPGPEVKKWLGDSIGWWEGDTLVVDTTNFHPKAAGFMGGTENAHVVERFTRQEDGNVLYNFTIKDDSYWEGAWTGEYVWRASAEKVYEYACHEGNYALGNIMRGARLLEEEALAAK